jgi:succinate-semialdehyde dehydrogenase/glutarate-semialdehyde dehydrogenase
MLKLSDPTLFETRAYINGEWTSSATTFPVVNPSTGVTLGEVSDVDREALEVLVQQTKTSQRLWAKQTGKHRAAVLRRWHDLVLENTEDLATILTAEMGKPLSEARTEIAYGAGFIEWFAEEAKRIYGSTIPGHQPDKRIVVLKQPVGVVGAITPWNFPNAMVMRKVAPALAVGCGMILRPSELTPLSALALAVLAERAGVPKGIFNVVPTLDASGFGKEMCENPNVAKITFTGSTRVGKILMAQSAGQIKKLSLELGGNAPFIVFDDADLDAAVEGAIIAKFRNGGQTCVCANRIYIQNGVYDAFAEKLAKRVAAMTLGDGNVAGVDIGPMINSVALSKIDAHLQDAISKGAIVLAGGEKSSLGGTFYTPTVLANATSDMMFAKEETFGPLAPLFRFETEEDVIKQANDTEFGLSGYFYTQDIARVWRVAEQLETGIVGINTGLISTEVAPFGGVKQSGIGREGSHYGADDYLELKYLCIGEIN